MDTYSCVICKEAQSAPAYARGAGESAAGECYRLACGHAFHTTCLVTSLRFGHRACPACRDGEDAGGDVTLRLTVRRAGGGLHELWIDDEDESTSVTSSEVAPAPEICPVVHRLRCSNRKVQAAQRLVTSAVMRYRGTAQQLRRARREALDAAMRGFRRDWWPRHAQRVAEVDAALDAYYAVLGAEWDAARRAAGHSGPDADWRAQLWGASLMRAGNALREADGAPRHDPMRRTFWRR